MNINEKPLCYRLAGKRLPVYLEVCHYPNGRIALVMNDAEPGPDGEEVMTVTTNLPDAPCDPDEIYVKDWGGNEGVTAWLIANLIVYPVEQGSVRSGFVEVKRWRLQPWAFEKCEERP